MNFEPDVLTISKDDLYCTNASQVFRSPKFHKFVNIYNMNRFQRGMSLVTANDFKSDENELILRDAEWFVQNGFRYLPTGTNTGNRVNDIAILMGQTLRRYFATSRDESILDQPFAESAVHGNGCTIQPYVSS